MTVSNIFQTFQVTFVKQIIRLLKSLKHTLAELGKALSQYLFDHLDFWIIFICGVIFFGGCHDFWGYLYFQVLVPPPYRGHVSG